MLPKLKCRQRHLPLVAPFRISRGVKRAAEVVEVHLHAGGLVGRGEAVPYARYGESGDSVLEQVETVRGQVESGATRTDLLGLLEAGAARNAIDCAMWDLEAREARTSVSRLLGRERAGPMVSAVTIGIDTPDEMARKAAALSRCRLIKVKVDDQNPAARIRAVRAAAPASELIVDANEGWSIEQLMALQPVLVEARVALVEQPLPATDDDDLDRISCAVPLCADESCHVTEDLNRLAGRYQAVNVKLDKSGGLTEAIELMAAARRRGFKVMVGCMVCSSLGIAPALELARDADYVDLDGPSWLRDDYAGGAHFEDGVLQPPVAGFWGSRP